MDIEIKKLSFADLNDFIDLIRVFEDVFEMQNFNPPPSAHLQSLLDNSGFLVFVAKLQDKVIGGLTVYILDQYYSAKPLAYIYDLAVSVAHQRQGIGKKLISYLTEYCRENGFEEVFVQADRIDDYAIDFYRTTRPTNEEQVVHFYYTL
ncbi:GNAT family N-acetyltransferase [Negadavirga shengliensis]|uniref:GNAT family N-acetyltransferase n=1 Tax=Negadavirga shengliensis TaxID=1389218 RepID=A0ABV9SWK8_9BACT